MIKKIVMVLSLFLSFAANADVFDDSEYLRKAKEMITRLQTESLYNPFGLIFDGDSYKRIKASIYNNIWLKNYSVEFSQNFRLFKGFYKNDINKIIILKSKINTLKYRQGIIISFYRFYESYPEYQHRKTELLSFIIKTIFPDFRTKWRDHFDYAGHVIFRDNDLYSLERIKLPKKFEMTTYQGLGNMDMVNTNIKAMKIYHFGTTNDLMKHGHPGVGPDSEDVKICQLTYGADEPYFEISAYDMTTISNVISFQFEPLKHCWSGETLKNFWKERRMTLKEPIRYRKFKKKSPH